jgi:cytochrome c biogenesis protein CcmG, thiol:disulfide interchange protein DsbE
MNWRRSAWGVGISIPILALLAYGMTQDPNAFASTMPGRPAPEFELKVLDRPETIRLSDYHGEVVVINFWASWCMECRVEHSDLSTAASMFADRGVRFLGLLYNDSERNGLAWIREMGGQTYPAVIDEGSRTAVSYGLRGVPETFIIDQNGTVVHMQIGAITLSKLASIINPLLEQPPPQEQDAAVDATLDVGAESDLKPEVTP